jgi:2-dehydropantoate 2-reductase
MKACIFGAGAVGGHIAARLADSGQDVTVIARGPSVAAMAERGLTLKLPDRSIVARVKAFDDGAKAGPHDVVFVTVKANALPGIVPSLAPLLGRDTAVVFVVNGLPWWYAHGLPPAARRPPNLDRLDPGGRLARAVGMERVMGSVVYSGNEVLEPGVVLNRAFGPSTLIFGEIDGRRTARTEAIAKLLTDAGFKAPVPPDIRHAVWTKLVASNLANLPICSLLGQPLGVFANNPELVSVAKRIVREGMAVAAAYRYPLDIDPEASYEPSKLNATHKPSMAQDMERGRPLEIDAVLVAFQAFAREAGVPTPCTDTVTALLVQMARDKGLYSGTDS